MSRAHASLWASAALHAALPLAVSFDVEDIAVARQQALLRIELDALQPQPDSESTASAAQKSAPVPLVAAPAPRVAKSLRAARAALAAAAEQSSAPLIAPERQPATPPEPDSIPAVASLSAVPGDSSAPPVTAAGPSAARADRSFASRHAQRRADGDAIAVQSLRAAYSSRLRERVAAHRRYPYQARRAGLEGDVCLRLRVDARGRLTELRSTCAAPSRVLLEAALEAVRAAAPFGPLPAALGGELSVELPIVFRLPSNDLSEEQ